MLYKEWMREGWLGYLISLRIFEEEGGEKKCYMQCGLQKTVIHRRNLRQQKKNIKKEGGK